MHRFFAFLFGTAAIGVCAANNFSTMVHIETGDLQTLLTFSTGISALGGFMIAFALFYRRDEVKPEVIEHGQRAHEEVKDGADEPEEPSLEERFRTLKSALNHALRDLDSEDWDVHVEQVRPYLTAIRTGLGNGDHEAIRGALDQIEASTWGWNAETDDVEEAIRDFERALPDQAKPALDPQKRAEQSAE
jgi:hypothetical protein